MNSPERDQAKSSIEVKIDRSKIAKRMIESAAMDERLLKREWENASPEVRGIINAIAHEYGSDSPVQVETITRSLLVAGVVSPHQISAEIENIARFEDAFSETV